MRKRIAALCTLPLLLNPMSSAKVMQTPLASDCVEKVGLRSEIHRKVEEYEKVQLQNSKEIEYEVVEVVEEVEVVDLIPMTFEVSFYCGCHLCTTYATGITASGKQVQYGMVAAPDDIPFGTKIHIDGLGTFVNEDTGSFIKYTPDGHMRVDVYTESHTTALELGRFITNGYIEY